MIRRSSLHPTTASVLQHAGWTEERQVSTEDWREALMGEGYSWFNSAHVFLANLGGLVIPPAKGKEAVFGSGTFVTDPLLSLGEYERIKEREIELGVSLCPIGEWFGESIVLLSSRGFVYAETTYQILLLGASPVEAMELVIRAYRYPDLIKGSAWWVDDRE